MLTPIAASGAVDELPGIGDWGVDDASWDTGTLDKVVADCTLDDKTTLDDEATLDIEAMLDGEAMLDEEATVDDCCKPMDTTMPGACLTASCAPGFCVH